MSDPLPPYPASSTRSGKPFVRRLLILWLSLAAGLPLEAGAQQPVGFAYYDADRLYDTVPALFYDDSDFTPQGRLRWTAERYARKIARTAAVLDSMRMDIVALAGVETEAVVRDLVVACREDYCYIHRTFNTFDGLDIALLYHGDRFFSDRIEQGRGWLYVEGELAPDGPPPFADTDPGSTPDPDSTADGRTIRSTDGAASRTSARTPSCAAPDATPASRAVSSSADRRNPSDPRNRRIGILACNNARYAAEALADCREQHPDIPLVAAGRFGTELAGRHGMRDLSAAAERAGRGNIRYRDGWRMRERILADTALRTSAADVYLRRFLFDVRRGTPLATYGKTRYLGGYGNLLPVFTYLVQNYLEY